MTITHENQAKICAITGKWWWWWSGSGDLCRIDPSLVNYSELFPCKSTVYILCVTAEPDHSIVGPIS